MTTARRANPSSSNQRAIAVARQIIETCKRLPFLRDVFIILAFCALTSAMTWPYVTRLRDAVADTGDPSLHAYIMWWDYHQTFTDPLHLFNANIFYPLKYTLAFTESEYGIALLFFPLYALGLHPLTVLSVATFLGFAFSGYGAFRLTRTLTASNVAAWTAGIIFAFIPFRFHVLSQVTYVFGGWIPLLLEALVLFARERSWKRSAWLAVAFTMNALTGFTWLSLSLTPLVFSALFLITHYGLWRDRKFWLRGAVAAAASIIALLPFVLPYLYVSKAYGFTWSREVVDRGSPGLARWFAVEQRNRLWRGFGNNLPGGPKMFPGLLPLLLSIAAIVMSPFQTDARSETNSNSAAKPKWVWAVDVAAVIAAALTVMSVGWANTDMYPLLAGFFFVLNTDRALLVLALIVVFRLIVSYPQLLRRITGAANLVENVKHSRRGEAVWLGVIWTITGVLLSIGTNSWLFRLLFDFVFIFHSMREPSRAAMIAGVGLSVLGGIGAANLVRAIGRGRARAALVVAGCIVLALLFELRAAPLRMERGPVYPDAVTLRLKETPMRGGLVELPASGPVLPHLYVLRAADHGKPLINAISTFVPPHAWEIQQLSNQSPIPSALLDAMEKVPASYLVIHNSLIDPVRRPVFDDFLLAAMSQGRLRFIRRFDQADDLYAVVKTEPQAKSEAVSPLIISVREWATLIDKDPLNVLGRYESWSDRLVRLHIASFGSLPRYREFMRDAHQLGTGVIGGAEDTEARLLENFQRLSEEWVIRSAFITLYRDTTDEDFVARVYANAGVGLDEATRTSLAAELKNKQTTRAAVLLKLVDDPQFTEREKNRSLVLLHFFAYLRRNPDDPPDKNMNGFLHWVLELDKGYNPALIGPAFAGSFEHERIVKQAATTQPARTP
jgi:hypothetical protein